MGTRAGLSCEAPPASNPGHESYVDAPRSEALPELDLDELATYLERTPTSRARREYRAALRARGTDCG